MNDCADAGENHSQQVTRLAANAAAAYCPNCSTKLKESRCKMSCSTCGFYLSCADLY
jgi:hypothetical protein